MGSAMAIWPKHEIVELTEATLNAWSQAVEAVAEITGLPPQQAHAQLLAFINTPWEVQRWKKLTDKTDA